MRIIMEAKKRMKSALKRLFLAKCRISVELRRGIEWGTYKQTFSCRLHTQNPPSTTLRNNDPLDKHWKSMSYHMSFSKRSVEQWPRRKIKHKS